MNQHNAISTSSLQEFLTPESMLTPGVAGSLTMMITNALAVNFSAPRAWIGLLLSFVFGLLVLASAKGIVQKSIFYVLNSLVIFCVAVGANGIGASGPAHTSLFNLSSAFAQTNVAPSVAVPPADAERCANIANTVEAAQRAGATNDQVLSLIKPCQDLSRAVLQDLQSGPGPNNEISKAIRDSGKGFFAPWRF